MYVMLVEDNLTDRLWMQRLLRDKQHEVLTFETAQTALECAQQRPPDVLITDYRLPRSANGFQLAAAIRRLSFRCVIMVVSASVEMAQVHEGIQSGIDDLLKKPIRDDLDDLMWEAVLRRQAWLPPAQDIHSGDLSLDRATRTATWKQCDLDLSPMQFAIVAALLTKPGAVFSQRELYRIATGFLPEKVAARVLIKPHIQKIRQKMNRHDPNGYTHLIGVRGEGFKWSIDGEFTHDQADD